MNVNGRPMRTIRLIDGETGSKTTDHAKPGIEIIDQRKLPHVLEHVTLWDVDDVAKAIQQMYVRGAPLIGATAALGVYIAVHQTIIEMNLQATELGSASVEASFLERVRGYADQLLATRPTAVNLRWAIGEQMKIVVEGETIAKVLLNCRENALKIIEDDVEQCRKIGEAGLEIIREIAQKKPNEPIHILTHCNAGWLATVDWGTATSPMYHAFEAGIDIHVWVDETRPRNQGAKLTAWELGQHGIKHTVIADNVGGHLMQHGLVDLVLVGSDRTSRNGDVANKIGTYLKALAARDNGVPFYVALPSTTLDMTLVDGVDHIPIEQREAREVTHVDGLMESPPNGGAPYVADVLITPPDSPACNYAFDVTPSRLVTGLITERGVCEANEAAIVAMFGDLA